jgi:hypothetical protein
LKKAKGRKISVCLSIRKCKLIIRRKQKARERNKRKWSLNSSRQKSQSRERARERKIKRSNLMKISLKSQ